MSQYFLLRCVLFIFLVCSVPAFSQVAQKPVKKGEHTINFQYAYTYESCVPGHDKAIQSLPGFGYQYTGKKNWYIGADFQYDLVKRTDYHYQPIHPTGDLYTYLSPKIPGGIGYFSENRNMANRFTIINSQGIFKTPLDADRLTKKLYAERYNLSVHGGKRWQRAKSQFEAGLTLGGTFIRSFAPAIRNLYMPIPTTDKTSGAAHSYSDFVEYVTRNEQINFMAGVGLHLRYSYQITNHFSVGIQTLATGNVDGIYAQFAPRVIYKL